VTGESDEIQNAIEKARSRRREFVVSFWNLQTSLLLRPGISEQA
jgi:hypothetical protein